MTCTIDIDYGEGVNEDFSFFGRKRNINFDLYRSVPPLSWKNGFETEFIFEKIGY